MAITMEEVRNAILPEEPDYQRAAALGQDALPYLSALAVDDDTMLAVKAVSLAGLIGGRRAVRIVEEAAESERAELRVIAAAAAGNLGESGEPVITTLLEDTDRGVRKYAVRSVTRSSSEGLKARLEALQERETDPRLLEQVNTKLRGLR